jgi:hypothetical protein
MSRSHPARAHLITGGFPAGVSAGHDHDFVRLRLLTWLHDAGVPASTANDFTDLDRWLKVSRLLISFVAGPFPEGAQHKALRQWIAEGGRWIGIHGTSGGRAAPTTDPKAPLRRDGKPKRAIVRQPFHETLGCVFLNHPPIHTFPVNVVAGHPITKGLPASFEVLDELYMVELLDPEHTRPLVTADLPVDTSPPDYGFYYEKDTALQPDGRSRVLVYERELGKGAVCYVALGHNYSPLSEKARVPGAVDGKMEVFRGAWASPHYETLMRNAIAWGMAD